MTIQQIRTDDEIASTFDVMHQLRPHLERDSYVALVRSLEASDGFKLAAVVEAGTVRAVAGYRFMRMLYCDTILYVDDLVTDEASRSEGHGHQLLEWLEAEGRAHGCTEIQLISRVVREQAHRFYFRERFGIECFHFRKPIRQS